MNSTETRWGPVRTRYRDQRLLVMEGGEIVKRVLVILVLLGVGLFVQQQFAAGGTPVTQQASRTLTPSQLGLQCAMGDDHPIVGWNRALGVTQDGSFVGAAASPRQALADFLNFIERPQTIAPFLEVPRELGQTVFDKRVGGKTTMRVHVAQIAPGWVATGGFQCAE